jgi:hypothetical protein
MQQQFRISGMVLLLAVWYGFLWPISLSRTSLGRKISKDFEMRDPHVLILHSRVRHLSIPPVRLQFTRHSLPGLLARLPVVVPTPLTWILLQSSPRSRLSPRRSASRRLSSFPPTWIRFFSRGGPDRAAHLAVKIQRPYSEANIATSFRKLVGEFCTNHSTAREIVTRERRWKSVPFSAVSSAFHVDKPYAFYERNSRKVCANF